MPSQIVVRGYGSFGEGCVVSKGYGCAAEVARSTSCIATVKAGGIRNNRITVFGGSLQHKSTGENQTASADHLASELGNKFDDPRYYGRIL